MACSGDTTEEWQTTEYEDVSSSITDGRENEKADGKLLNTERERVWLMIKEFVKYLGLILTAYKELVEDRDAMKHKYVDLATKVETAGQKLYNQKTSLNKDQIDQANKSSSLLEKGDVCIIKFLSIDDQHLDKVKELGKLAVQVEKSIIKHLLECRQRFGCVQNEKYKDGKLLHTMNSIESMMIKVDQLVKLSYSTSEVEGLKKVKKGLESTVLDIKMLKDEISGICEKEGKVPEVGMLIDETQGIMDDENSNSELYRDLNGEINHLIKDSTPRGKNIVDVSVNGPVKQSVSYLCKAKFQKLESKIEKLLYLISSKTAPCNEGPEMMNLEETGNLLESKKNVPVISLNNGLVQNIYVLMAGSFENHEEITIFLSSVESWLTKQTIRGGNLLKSHSEIKAIWKMLRDKRKGFQEEIYKLMAMHQQLRQTVDRVAEKCTGNGAMISNFYAQHNRLGNELNELNRTVYRSYKEEPEFVDALKSCYKMHDLLGNEIYQLEEEMSKFLGSINIVRIELNSLNVDLWTSQEVITRQESTFLKMADVQRDVVSEEWKVLHNKLDVIADERYEITSLHMELCQKFEELKIDYEENNKWRAKYDSELVSKELEIREMNIEYLNQLKTLESILRLDEQRIRSSMCDLQEDKRLKLIDAMVGLKRINADVVVEGFQNQENIDKFYGKRESSLMKERNLINSTDIESIKLISSEYIIFRRKTLLLEDERSKLIALSRNLRKRKDSLYDDLLDSGVVVKPLPAGLWYGPTKSFSKDDELREAIEQNKWTNNSLEKYENERVDLLLNFADLRKRNFELVHKSLENKTSMKACLPEMKGAELQVIKNWNNRAIEQLKIELERYEIAFFKLRGMRNDNCKLLVMDKQFRATIDFTWVSNEEKFSQLQSQLLKSEQIVQTMTDKFVNQLAISHSEAKRLKLWHQKLKMENSKNVMSNSKVKAGTLNSEDQLREINRMEAAAKWDKNINKRCRSQDWNQYEASQLPGYQTAKIEKLERDNVKLSTLSEHLVLKLQSRMVLLHNQTSQFKDGEQRNDLELELIKLTRKSVENLKGISVKSDGIKEESLKFPSVNLGLKDKYNINSEIANDGEFYNKLKLVSKEAKPGNSSSQIEIEVLNLARENNEVIRKKLGEVEYEVKVLSLINKALKEKTFHSDQDKATPSIMSHHGNEKSLLTRKMLPLEGWINRLLSHTTGSKQQILKSKEDQSASWLDTYGKYQGKFEVPNSVILEIIFSSLELLCGTSFHQNKDTTRFHDYQPEIDDLHVRLGWLCASFSSYWSYLREKSSFNLGNESERAISYLEDNMQKASIMVKGKNDAISRLILKLAEELELVRAAIEDHWDPDIFVKEKKNMTVETRVLVEGISWCLVKWCCVDGQNRGHLPYKSKYFWTTQDTFLKKLSIEEEDYDFPPFLNFKKTVSQDSNYSTQQ